MWIRSAGENYHIRQNVAMRTPTSGVTPDTTSVCTLQTSLQTVLNIAVKFIHLVVCFTTGPKPLPNRALQIMRSRASAFNCEYPLLSLSSSSSFLRLHPRLPTSIPPLIFPSITCCRRQFLCKV